MNVADALACSLLALANLALIAHWRQVRLRRERHRRMMRSLEMAIQRETFAAADVPQKRPVSRRSSAGGQVAQACPSLIY